MSRLKTLQELYQYDGIETCAADGMCAEKCPVAINTGEFIKEMRKLQTTSFQDNMSMFIAKNYKTAMNFGKLALFTTSTTHSIFGSNFIISVNNLLKKISPNGLIPTWNKFFPLSSNFIPTSSLEEKSDKVIYFPSCVSRLMGPSADDNYLKSTPEITLEILKKAKYQVIIPKNIESLCCGLSFHSKGLINANDYKVNELLDHLLEISEDGKYPILCETSPCLFHLKSAIKSCSNSKYFPLVFSLYEPIDFISLFLENRLQWNQIEDNIILHVPCSSKKMKLQEKMLSIANKCAKNVIDSAVPCCGMAGDRGMRYPELSDSAGMPLKRVLNSANEQNIKISHGFSTSRTCEIQMANQSSIQFSSLLHLVNSATIEKP